MHISKIAGALMLSLLLANHFEFSHTEWIILLTSIILLVKEGPVRVNLDTPVEIQKPVSKYEYRDGLFNKNTHKRIHDIVYDEVYKDKYNFVRK